MVEKNFNYPHHHKIVHMDGELFAECSCGYVTLSLNIDDSAIGSGIYEQEEEKIINLIERHTKYYNMIAEVWFTPDIKPDRPT